MDTGTAPLSNTDEIVSHRDFALRFPGLFRKFTPRCQVTLLVIQKEGFARLTLNSQLPGAYRQQICSRLTAAPLWGSQKVMGLHPFYFPYEIISADEDFMLEGEEEGLP